MKKIVGVIVTSDVINIGRNVRGPRTNLPVQ